ncbi:unnamed protein product [Prorocentrum cordatum]|uniref:K Homology domain-containing protein n=1 Tax=Prorocentrum cordatum TaxID=2364126 RepID=A0ABN9XVG4_9DINO|nr:unnamed protein product [Polarella glacialis]
MAGSVDALQHCLTLKLPDLEYARASLRACSRDVVALLGTKTHVPDVRSLLQHPSATAAFTTIATACWRRWLWCNRCHCLRPADNASCQIADGRITTLLFGGLFLIAAHHAGRVASVQCSECAGSRHGRDAPAVRHLPLLKCDRGAVIGAKGNVVEAIRRETGARVQVPPPDVAQDDHRLTLSGTWEQFRRVNRAVEAVLLGASVNDALARSAVVPLACPTPLAPPMHRSRGEASSAPLGQTRGRALSRSRWTPSLSGSLSRSVIIHREFVRAGIVRRLPPRSHSSAGRDWSSAARCSMAASRGRGAGRGGVRRPSARRRRRRLRPMIFVFLPSALARTPWGCVPLFLPLPFYRSLSPRAPPPPPPLQLLPISFSLCSLCAPSSDRGMRAESDSEFDARGACLTVCFPSSRW